MVCDVVVGDTDAGKRGSAVAGYKGMEGCDQCSTEKEVTDKFICSHAPALPAGK